MRKFLLLLPLVLLLGASTTYPIPAQPGIYPPEAPGWNLGATPPRGATGATGWTFIENNIYDSRTSAVDVDYLAVKGIVNGQTVTLAIDDYGTATGQQAWASGDWTSRADLSDPSLEIPGVVADAWGTTYLTTISGNHPAYATQLWNASPGALPRHLTKVWAEMRVRVNGSGLVCFGWDWYGANGYIGNAGYSGFRTYLKSGATPTWQVITLGK
jgi:hypothetical protein